MNCSDATTYLVVISLIGVFLGVMVWFAWILSTANHFPDVAAMARRQQAMAEAQLRQENALRPSVRDAYLSTPDITNRITKSGNSDFLL